MCRRRRWCPASTLWLTTLPPLSPLNCTFRLAAFSICSAKVPVLPATTGTVVIEFWSVAVYR